MEQNFTTPIIEETKTNTVTYEYVENTPFTAVCNNGKYYIFLGSQCIIKYEFDTLAELKKYISKKGWELITNTIIAVNLKMRENETKTTETTN